MGFVPGRYLKSTFVELAESESSRFGLSGDGTTSQSSFEVPPHREVSTNSQGDDDMRAKQMKTLEDLFLDGLKDIYYAEKQILKALPKMAGRGVGRG